ncbi:hypothetical protein CVT26_015241 [Gymnopilus dilepis]|uniref:Uncharacterized protein n=1 Tax=Gymnopilus dilepis TaxID=231916 RepID=A0A409W422_9AGAR|nr:hypothetical protein CVT26_015241 [Gymnopilus dilepis]
MFVKKSFSELRISPTLEEEDMNFVEAPVKPLMPESVDYAQIWPSRTPNDPLLVPELCQSWQHGAALQDLEE